MFKKISKMIMAIFGAFVGYGVYRLTNIWCIELGIIKNDNSSFLQSTVIAVIFAIIFSIIGQNF